MPGALGYLLGRMLERVLAGVRRCELRLLTGIAVLGTRVRAAYL